jgi:hypothetical protein
MRKPYDPIVMAAFSAAVLPWAYKANTWGVSALLWVSSNASPKSQ